MDPLDFLKQEELLRFLRRKKTEISCMDQPHTFLSQLRDYDLVSEKLYQVSKNFEFHPMGLLYWVASQPTENGTRRIMAVLSAKFISPSLSEGNWHIRLHTGLNTTLCISAYFNV